jgi:hypothetical protein
VDGEQQLVGADRPQRDDHDTERHRVAEEDRAGAEDDDQCTGESGADHLAQVLRRAAQSDRVRQVDRVHGLGDERVAHGDLHRTEDPEQHREEEDVPQPRSAWL